MQKKIFFILLNVVVLISACKQDKSQLDLMIGKWRGTKWLVGGIPQNGFDPSIITFEFKQKKDSSLYKAQFGPQSETGTFNLKNNCFNAMSIYGSPKKCPILRLEKDTMVWLMDSVQQPGHLYLVRVKD